MKKGQKLTEDGYLLEIRDLTNDYWSAPATYKSLRQAVADASERVHDMDSYLKVYRDYNSMGGVYVGVFFSKSEVQPKQHLIVKISAFELLTAAGIAHALDFLKRDSENMPKARARR